MRSFVVQPGVDWTKNLALKMPARQSTLYSSAVPASRAVDGNRNTNFHKLSCTHTQEKTGSWWEVDLGAVYEIWDVVLTNRDEAEERLKGFVIEVVRGGNTRQCASVAGQLEKGETRRITCTVGAIGNIVKVRLTGKAPQVLTLCEVEVFGVRGKSNLIDNIK